MASLAARVVNDTCGLLRVGVTPSSSPVKARQLHLRHSRWVARHGSRLGGSHVVCMLSILHSPGSSSGPNMPLRPHQMQNVNSTEVNQSVFGRLGGNCRKELPGQNCCEQRRQRSVTCSRVALRNFAFLLCKSQSDGQAPATAPATATPADLAGPVQPVWCPTGASGADLGVEFIGRWFLSHVPRPALTCAGISSRCISAFGRTPKACRAWWAAPAKLMSRRMRLRGCSQKIICVFDRVRRCRWRSCNSYVLSQKMQERTCAPGKWHFRLLETCVHQHWGLVLEMRYIQLEATH